LTDLRKQ